MSKAVKFAVSVSDDEFKELELFRKKSHLSRSEFIRETIKLWKEETEKKRLVRAYEEGYRRIPESPVIVKGWEKASLSALSSEEW